MRQATTPPADHGGQIEPAAPNGAAHHTEPLQAQRGADSPAAAPRTPEPVRPDTWMPRTPRHRTRGCWTRGRWTSARPVGRTSHGGTGRGGQATTGPAGVRTSSDRRHPLGGPTSPGMRAAPRRTAVVCWSWRVRGEGNGTTDGRTVRSQACEGSAAGMLRAAGRRTYAQVDGDDGAGRGTEVAMISTRGQRLPGARRPRVHLHGARAPPVGRPRVLMSH